MTWPLRLYNSFLGLVGPLIGILLGLLPKFSFSSAERNGFGDWKHLQAGSEEKTVWIHAASVGEVNGIKPLVRRLQSSWPGYRFVISTTSETGKAAALKLSPHVALLPFDYPQAVSRVIAKVRPDLFILAETEIWPVLLSEIKKRDIPLAIVNARISDYSWGRYKFFKNFLGPLMSHARVVAAQSDRDEERFISLGCDEEAVVVSGTTKYDNLLPLKADPSKMLANFCFKAEGKVFVAGSVRPSEDRQVVNVFKNLRARLPDLKMIVAPRHPEEFENVAALLEEAGVDFSKRSESGKGEDVLLLDTIGELSAAYQVATVAFVGATLVDIGGHNPMEPAVAKVPVIVGPHHSNVLEEVELLEESGGIFVVEDSSQLEEVLFDLFDDQEKHSKASEGAFNAWKQASGATDKVFPLLASAGNSSTQADYGLRPAVILPLVMTGLSFLFGFGTRVRNLLFDTGLLKEQGAELPVISVGNVTVGGSGKTPTTSFLCALFRKQGLRPVIVTRGYKGNLEGPHLVGRHDKVEDVGDEALMQCRKYDPDVKIVVAKKRVEGASFVKENNLGDVILLDDGFQHRWLKRDLNLLLVDPSEPNFVERWSKPKLLPAGRFRENPRKAFHRADIVVFVLREWKIDKEKFEESVSLVRERYQPSSIVFLQLSADQAISIDGEQERALSDFKDASVVTALAQPGQFSEMLEASGVKVKKRAFFPDHFSWTESGWRELSRQLVEPVLVTEKDATKLCRFNMVQEEDIWVVPLKVRMVGKETPRIIEEAIEKISSKVSFEDKQQAKQTTEKLAAS
jgi:tetraacyldisaccharide 4'-kinase